MEIHNNLSAKMTLQHQLSLNANVLQSLEILRMPLQELREMVVQKSYENPLLEMNESDSDFEEDAIEIVSAKEADTDSDGDIDTTVNEIYSAGVNAEVEKLTEGQAKTQTFKEMLYEQISVINMDEGFAYICKYLVDCLDRKGYFYDDPGDIAKAVGIREFDVMQALYAVQSLEPAGVGARNLQECLMLQLMRGEHFNQYTIRLAKDGLDLIAQNDVESIKKLLMLDYNEAVAVCNIIRGLNPIPSQGFYTGEDGAEVIPDILVKEIDGRFALIYNRKTLPMPQVNNDYVKMLRKNGNDTSAYLNEKMAEAKYLIGAMQKREKTLTLIVEQIVKAQPEFFAGGKNLVPMTMESIASQINLNVSTVSRAVQNKFVSCAAGTIELRRMFESGLKGKNSDMISVSMIKRLIETYIKEENPISPLSDEKICKALQSVDIDISRRTVAKYREELGIASSAARKAKHKAITGA